LISDILSLLISIWLIFDSLKYVLILPFGETYVKLKSSFKLFMIFKLTASAPEYIFVLTKKNTFFLLFSNRLIYIFSSSFDKDFISKFAFTSSFLQSFLWKSL
jgi:hypothetical protein